MSDNRPNEFVDKYLGMIILGFFGLACVALMISNANFFFSPTNLKNIVGSNVSLFVFAAITAMSIKVNTVNLFCIPLVTLGSVIYVRIENPIIGILVAIVVCVVFSAANGILIMTTKMPVWMTIIYTGAIALALQWCIIYGARGRDMIPRSPILDSRDMLFPVGLAIVLGSFLIMTGLLFWKDIGETNVLSMKAGNNKVAKVIVYSCAGFLCALAGIYNVERLMVVSLRLFNMRYCMTFIAFFLFAICSTKISNKQAASAIVVCAALIYVIASNLLMLLGVNIYFLQFIFIGMTVIMFIPVLFRVLKKENRI